MRLFIYNGCHVEALETWWARPLRTTLRVPQGDRPHAGHYQIGKLNPFQKISIQGKLLSKYSVKHVANLIYKWL